MAKYIYTALKDNKIIVKGELEAHDLREARVKIRALGYIPAKIYLEKENTTKDYSGNFSQVDVDKKDITFLSLKSKILFTSELEVLLSAGIPIIEALNSISSNVLDTKLSMICEKLVQSIMSGQTFSQAVEKLYGALFGPVYTGLLKAGEASGDLEATLRRLIVLLQKQESIKEKITKASIYPAILFVLMVGVLAIFSGVIFPAFYGVIQNSGGDVPFLAQTLVDFCNFLNHFWWFLLICFGAFCGWCSYLFKQESLKKRWDDFILKIYGVSDFIRCINLSNFMTVLYISYEAGVPIISCLELAEKTVGNYLIKKKASNIVNSVKAGKSLTEAFSRMNFLPGTLLSMVSTGEKSGNIGEMLSKAADAMDKKVDMALDTLTKLFEPTIIIIMGGFVLFIALAFYQLYFGMMGALF